MHHRTRCAPVRACALVLSAIAASACGDAPSPVEPGDPLLARARAARTGVSTVTVVAPSSLVEARDTAAVGEPLAFSARVSTRGRKTAPSVAWGVSSVPASGANGAPLAAVSAAGVVTTTGAAAVTVYAVVGADTGRYGFVTVAPAAAPDSAAAPPPSGGAPVSSPSSVAMLVRRFDGGSGTTVVSSGVPLVPGALRAGQEGMVRVLVGGVERAAFVAPLSGTHPDGSLRAVLVQFAADVPAGQSVPARLEIGQARAAALTASQPLAARASVPGAAFLPAEPAYLLATELVGRTIPAAQATALGSDFARYESDFTQYADVHWNSGGDYWENNYYDRALVYYAAWARSGNPEYWWRGTRHAVAYRRDYVEPTNYGVSAHWALPEGLERHYLLTGDEASRKAVAAVANFQWVAFANGGGVGSHADPRVTGRILLLQLASWRLGGHPDHQPFAYGGAAAGWAPRIELVLDGIPGWQVASGDAAGLYPGSQDAHCGGQFNFMAGILNDALIKTHEHYRADTRIRAIVQRSADYMWRTQWRADAQGFNYSTVWCATGGPEPATDMNGLIVPAYAWLYRQTGNAAYRAQGDAIFSGLVTQGWLGGQKHFNQAYSLSYQHLGWR